MTRVYRKKKYRNCAASVGVWERSKHIKHNLFQNDSGMTENTIDNPILIKLPYNMFYDYGDEFLNGDKINNIWSNYP